MPLYECKACDYSTDRSNNWNKHITTAKHQKNSQFNKFIDDEGKYTCNICNKKYKYKSGLSKHRAMHNNEEVNQVTNVESKNDAKSEEFSALYSLLQQSLNQNQENLDKLLPKVGNVTNNINKMTINVFLNDHCKDAMNISEFMDKVKLTVDDLYYTGENGYIKGITNIFVKNLTNLPATERPIHCCDKKKLEFYVKDENKWEKDLKNEKINKTIACLSKKQVSAIKLWEEHHPNWTSDELLTSEYINLVQKITSVEDGMKEVENIYKSIGHNTDWLQTANLSIKDE